MHGLLFFTLRDYITEGDDALSNWDLAQYADLCEQNFFKCLETYDSLAIPTLENIQSLILAVSHNSALFWHGVDKAIGYQSTRAIKFATGLDLCCRRPLHVPNTGHAP